MFSQDTYLSTAIRSYVETVSTASCKRQDGAAVDDLLSVNLCSGPSWTAFDPTRSQAVGRGSR